MFSNNASKLIDEVNNFQAPDFNYMYLNSGSPNIFTIIKRSSEDPLESFPLVNMVFMRDLKFAEMETLVKKLCEFYSTSEFEYRKANKDKIQKNVRMPKDDTRDD